MSNLSLYDSVDDITLHHHVDPCVAVSRAAVDRSFQGLWFPMHFAHCKHSHDNSIGRLETWVKSLSGGLSDFQWSILHETSLFQY